MSDVLVTGASRGIGRAIAVRLAHEGYNVVLHSRESRQQLEELKETLRPHAENVRILQSDIQDREATRACLSRDIEEHGCYYGVVCNAGIVRDHAFPMLSAEDWDQVIHTNLDGFYNVLAPLVMPMVQTRKPGRIITLSSVSGLAGNRGQVNYSASKAGIIGATKSLAIELAKRNITVNCIAPGIIETDMTRDVEASHIKSLIPLRRMGTPDEVASLASYLMSKDAAYITRQVISVNGGMY